MHNLTFIDFRPEYYTEVIPFFLRRPTLCCESSALYHVLWSEYYQTRFYMHDRGVLWLQKIDYDDVASMLPVCDAKDLVYNFCLLEEYYSEVLGKKMRMYLVDEEALRILSGVLGAYTVTEDVDSFDYIYSGDDLRNLSGKKYAKKRNNIQCFLREYQDCYEYRSLDETCLHDVTAYMERWLAQKADTDELHRLESEDRGFGNVWDSFSIWKDKVRIGGLYIKGVLSAFAVGSYEAKQDMAVIHMEKADASNRGIYPFLSREFLLREFPDVKYVNREDDMGIPGLRQAKKSYFPVAFAKKYTIIQE